MTEAAHDQRSGWRLVDVIVVIIILMVVAAIVLPGLQQARTGGGRVNECQNNLHNLAVAIEAYTTAHNGRLPPLDLRVQTQAGSVRCCLNWDGRISTRH